ncbi:hypothetical protein R1sor_020527 [Riccia sorocarpa]|uniref:Uncharacterized protein n=1 Tax=Riccia sorocarpa TaxID=122646 RepID=A0ABD3IJB1_9MARC
MSTLRDTDSQNGGSDEEPKEPELKDPELKEPELKEPELKEPEHEDPEQEDLDPRNPEDEGPETNEPETNEVIQEEAGHARKKTRKNEREKKKMTVRSLESFLNRFLFFVYGENIIIRE